MSDSSRPSWKSQLRWSKDRQRPVWKARVLPLQEELVEQGGVPSTVSYRPVHILDQSGKLFGREHRAADNRADIEKKINAAGFDVKSWVNDENALLARKPVSKGALGCLGIFVVVFLVFVASCTMSMGKDGSKDEPTESLAIVSCERIVKDRLKSPSSAKFSNQSATGSGNTWVSRGIVESQNSFGAMIATKYTCTVTFRDDGTYSGTARLEE